MLQIIALIFKALFDYDSISKKIAKQDANPNSCVHSNAWHKAHPNG